MIAFSIPGSPAVKPRQTRRDKWLKPARPPVARYRAWADLTRACAAAAGFAQLRDPAKIAATFYLPIPASLSERRRRELFGKPHRGKGRGGDDDNLLKALGDALLPDGDHGLYDCHPIKRWEDERGPRTEVVVWGMEELQIRA